MEEKITNVESSTVPSKALAEALGFEGIPDGDVRVPRARLAQGLTQEVMAGEAQAGSWILPGGKITKELVGTVVGVRRTRVLWDRSGPTAVVQCSSDDGITGIGNPGGLCDECPMAKWDGHTPPKCTLTYEYLLIQESGVPVVVPMSTRSAGTTIGTLNLALRTKGRVDVRLVGQLITKGNRRYYVPVAEFEW